MGTNYYLHLGKTFNQGVNKPMGYYMASDVANATGPFGRVMDEYGNDMSWDEFMAIETGCQVDVSTIGEDFS